MNDIESIRKTRPLPPVGSCGGRARLLADDGVSEPATAADAIDLAEDVFLEGNRSSLSAPAAIPGGGRAGGHRVSKRPSAGGSVGQWIPIDLSLVESSCKLLRSLPSRSFDRVSQLQDGRPEISPSSTNVLFPYPFLPLRVLGTNPRNQVRANGKQEAGVCPAFCRNLAVLPFSSQHARSGIPAAIHSVRTVRRRAVLGICHRVGADAYVAGRATGFAG
jgi:hypothetical protein